MQNEKEEFKKNFIKRLICYSVETVRFCEDLLAKRRYFTIGDQLIRSATSIGANIVEAKSSSSRRDYLKFFEIALKSANETKYWLIVLRELKEDRDAVNKLLSEAEEISRVIGSSVLTLKGKK